MNIPFCMGVGGSFDVVAGKFKRAPWMGTASRFRMGVSVETRTTPNVQTKRRGHAQVCSDGFGE